ncbi:MAG: type II toxin-antitoxin system Phd/YefM family antitoxin [Pseudobdellovibrionaceae bacterium]|jgi:prevent-host-death family protein
MNIQNSVGSFEAKTHFAQLVERASHGEVIFITRRGKPVAKLVPADTNNNSETAMEAVVRLRALAKEMNLGQFDWEEWKSYRDMGRT